MSHDVDPTTDDGAPGYPVPPDEESRLVALERLAVLDRPRDPDLDALTRLAAYVAGTDLAVINLVDATRQWQASAFGGEPGEVDRADSMCARSILSRDITYVPDASQDVTFADNPFVTGDIDSVRLYASAPLIVSTGEVVGTLCSFDRRPGELSRTQLERLRDLADQTVRLMELRSQTELLTRAATRDPLTGLPNRRLLDEALGRAFARRARGETEPAVLFVDVDEFKTVNDTHGHGAGDQLLRDVAQRLLGAVRAVDLVARVGGDEFVVLLELPDERAPLDPVLDRVTAALAQPYDVRGASVPVSSSVGSARAQRPFDTPGDLLRRADEAMYGAKRGQ
ncbi:diguanylate cyclase [Angustibacter peucedani]